MDITHAKIERSYKKYLGLVLALSQTHQIIKAKNKHKSDNDNEIKSWLWNEWLLHKKVSLESRSSPKRFSSLMMLMITGRNRIADDAEMTTTADFLCFSIVDKLMRSKFVTDDTEVTTTTQFLHVFSRAWQAVAIMFWLIDVTRHVEWLRWVILERLYKRFGEDCVCLITLMNWWSGVRFVNLKSDSIQESMGWGGKFRRVDRIEDLLFIVCCYQKCWARLSSINTHVTIQACKKNAIQNVVAFICQRPVKWSRLEWLQSSPPWWVWITLDPHHSLHLSNDERDITAIIKNIYW